MSEIHGANYDRVLSGIRAKAMAAARRGDTSASRYSRFDYRLSYQHAWDSETFRIQQERNDEVADGGTTAGCVTEANTKEPTSDL